MKPRNIVLTGFMGTGKTAIGRAVAEKLGRDFVDMDAEIEARAGKSIARIFREEGEATFRSMEAMLCAELGERQGLVVATGGGALLDAANRAAMARSGSLICLTCDASEILRRLGEMEPHERPLLDVPDRRAEIERLMRVRRGTYAAIPWQVDTTGLGVKEAMEQVIALANVITLPVSYPGGQYQIHIGEGTLGHIGGVMRASGVPEASRVAIVSNPVVAPLYAAQVQASLRSAGLEPFVCSIPDGEPSGKTLAALAALYDQLLAGDLERGDTVLALGGGVSGDVAGLAAATFMRGVRLVQAPTTLLAMVDASVGGKTGVDLPQGKNLVGAYKFPSLVMMDTTTLLTLPAQEVRSGLAEVIKHGIIGDPELFAELEQGVARTGMPADRIARALRVKIAVVEDDPFEQGRRAVLNLGHTVGHALERLNQYALRHGEAVGLGLVAAARIAVELGRAEPALPGRIERALSEYDLPVRCPPVEADAILAAMAHDKKKQGRALRWVLPRAVGEVEITTDVPLQVVRSVLCGMGARNES